MKLLGVATLGAISLAAASFDCSKATTAIEKTICADKELSNLDEYLGRYYAAARQALGRGGECLRIDQARWLKEARNRCGDAGCLKNAYLARLGEFDALQPGATALKSVDLPRVPALVWVVPAAEDTTAFPSNPKATPLRLTGFVLRTEEGFILRTADGKAVSLVQDMALEGSTAAQLESLATNTAARYSASGHAADQRTFEPSRCVYIHRLP